MLLFRVARRCICRNAPVLSCLRPPELFQTGVTVKIDDDQVRTALPADVISLAVAINEKASAPPIAFLDPFQKPRDVNPMVEPTVSCLLRVRLVDAALVRRNLDLHYRPPTNETVQPASESAIHIATTDHRQ